MKIKFYKYQATGNDFIIIDNRNQDINLTEENIRFLCDRHFGIGSDGLILLENSQEADFAMQFFNPDGSGGMMCGNGGRSIVRFAFDLGIIKKSCSFIAPDGLHFAEINAENIKLKMVIPTLFQEFEDGYYINTGTSHFVSFENSVLLISLFRANRHSDNHQDTVFLHILFHAHQKPCRKALLPWHKVNPWLYQV